MPKGVGYKGKNKSKNLPKKNKIGGLGRFVADFFTPKKGSLVANMKKGVSKFQRGSMKEGGMGR
jgi:hypothetical protein